ncbi:unnamed protein product [Blepharisma stoltei]|uniref:Uncharacterized protein n=1 Tax=Blepharisma stoltei TaxID=1481888 RepID=A0AAU9JBZ1_9CILI|nr:unnamed protein product [Blepharisma stoltei]
MVAFIMKIWFIALLALVFALEEPDPINDQERNDEVAQAQARARWIACLLISRTKLSQHSSEISSIYSASKFDKDLIEKKIIGEILYKCDQLLSWKQAEELLAADEINLEKPEIKELTTIDKDFYINPKSDIKLTQQQEDLIKKIIAEAKKTGDGFDQDPPTVPGFDAQAYIQSKGLLPPAVYYLGLGGGVLLLVGLAFFILKKATAVEEKKPAGAEKKSKKEKKEQ